jgi:thiol-disulfide isomerase/thioredoxin
VRSEASPALTAAALVAALLVCACQPEHASASPAPPPERFAGVKKTAAASTAASSSFCERSFPKSGEQSRRYVPPALRPLASGDGAPSPPNRWIWLNLWATWCTPCIEEMALLRRWKDGFAREGIQVAFELLSIDDSSQGKALNAWRSRDLPGPIRWIRSEEDLAPLLSSLGVGGDASIPIHALVDPSGLLRCVRVGAIHEQDYGAVRQLLSQ